MLKTLHRLQAILLAVGVLFLAILFNQSQSKPQNNKNLNYNLDSSSMVSALREMEENIISK